MEKIKSKLIWRVVGICLLISGFITAVYPFASNFIKTRQMNEEMAHFEEVISEISKQDDGLNLSDREENGGDIKQTERTYRPMSELYQWLKNYNDNLWLGGQNIRSESEFTSFGIDLTEFGLDRDVIGIIEIPKIDVKLPLYLGADKMDMYRGAAVLAQTSAPIGGPSTNCVIAGHRGDVGADMFRDIDELETGDKVYIRNPWGVLTYEVQSSEVVEKTDISKLKITENEDRVALMSCHPYRINNKRLFVYCIRID